MAEAVVRLFYPHVEAVLHDVETDTVVGIWNAFSGRRPGDPSLLEPELLEQVPGGGVIGPYAKAGLHGEQINSISVVVADGAGLLCLNFDRSVLVNAVATLEAFSASAVASRPSALFARDWREEINSLVQDWCTSEGVSPRRLSPGDRERLVAMLDAKGAFRVRHAVTHLAAALDVSRATVYAALKGVRDAEPA